MVARELVERFLCALILALLLLSPGAIGCDARVEVLDPEPLEEGPDETRVLVGKVVRVNDGDTITIADGNQRPRKVRLEGIDAPEVGQPFGNASKRALTAMLSQRTARVEWTRKDQYGRLLGQVYHDDEHINYSLVARGFAWQFQYNSDDRLAAAEAKARKKRLGLWADENPIPPWKYRQQQPARPGNRDESRGRQSSTRGAGGPSVR